MGSERLRNLSGVTQLGNGGADMANKAIRGGIY